MSDISQKNPGDQPPVKGTYLVWGVAIAMTAIGVLYFLFGGTATKERQFGDETPGVRVAETVTRPFADVIEAIGTARANESVTLTAQVSEIVQRVNFTDGMKVQEGTILVELTNREELAQVSEAEANLREARQQYDRVKDLVAEGTVAQATLDQRTRALEEARSRLAAAVARTEDRVITAPFSGRLGLRNISPGTLISPGTTITTLDDLSIIKVDFSIPERFLSALQVGQQIVTYSAAYPDHEFEGTVTTIDPRIDPVTRAVTLRAELPNDEDLLRPGMLMTVDLTNNPRNALAVPETAIAPQGANQYVFVLTDENTVRRTEVGTGARAGGFVEITSGLSPGDEVVVSGALRLRDGIDVQVMGHEPAAAPNAVAGSTVGGQQ